MTPEDVVRFIGEIVGPTDRSKTETELLVGSCRSCGDPVAITVEVVDGKVRVTLDHQPPVCARMALYLEGGLAAP